jgi:hypothetical protein
MATLRVNTTKARLDKAYAALMANAKLPFGSARRTSTANNSTPINVEFDAAYTDWMQARAEAGHVFALNRGYTANGWSIDGWMDAHA